MSGGAQQSFSAQVEQYLSHWRALGRGYRQEAWLLRKLAAEFASAGCSRLDAASFSGWLGSLTKHHPNTRRKWVQIVRRLCIFQRRHEPTAYVPAPELVGIGRPHITPTIIDPLHVSAALRSADLLEASPNSPLRSANMRIAIVLLFTTGMRLGELRRLTVGDVEDDGATLRVRESKFHRSRLVPLSPSAGSELERFLRTRAATSFDSGAGSPLLCTRARGRMKPYSSAGLQHGLNRLLRSSVPQTSRPRVHDLRHSFAVHALARWYRAGADVQAQLPKLSMYMGHVSIESTAYYLQWTDEVAGLASKRFEQHFGAAIGGQS